MQLSTPRSIPLLRLLAVGLSAFVSVLAVVAWGESMRWRFGHLSTYQLFPLFGLLAFSLLWAQYAVLALLRVWAQPIAPLQRYFTVSGYFVLGALLLHPSLLVWQLWRDGFGLPPESYLKHFVAPGLEWVALLGTFSLFLFLAYELHRVFGDRSWWRFVFYASDVAMAAVLYHGLRLGSTLQAGWYRGVWFVYAVTFAAALICLHGRVISSKG